MANYFVNSSVNRLVEIVRVENLPSTNRPSFAAANQVVKRVTGKEVV